MNEFDVIVNASKTTCDFDNLRVSMREAFYSILRDGRRATHILSGHLGIVGYEMCANQNDPPTTMFKNLPVIFDTSVPADEMQFMQDGRVVGRIIRIS